MYVYDYTDDQKNAEDMIHIDSSDSSEYNDEDYVDENESESEFDYESDDESDEEESESEEESDEEEEDEYDEEEERHQFYRQQAFEFNQIDNEEDDDVLSDTDTVILQSPPQLRRERPEDYLTPVSVRETVTPRAPRAYRSSVVLRDITNIVPRRLAFN